MRRHTAILLGGLAGVVLGLLANALLGDAPALENAIRYGSRPVGQVFLRLLFMLVLPLVFSALALGVVGMGDLRSLGRVGAKTLAYTVVVSGIAVLLGVTLVNTLRPGAGMPPAVKARLLEGAAERAAGLPAGAAAPRAGFDLLVEIIPDNVVRAAADGQILGVMFFSLALGVGLTLAASPGAQRLQEVLDGLYAATMRLLELVLLLAPVGVAALLFTLTAELGFSVLVQLARYVAVVLLALAIHQFVVYSLAVRFLGGMSPRAFFRGIQEAMVTAFSTASSNATLPTALRVAEERLGIAPRIGRFVLTIGATANQNGTALFEGVTVLFLAQFYDVSLTLAQQSLVVFICVLGGIGTAGVPAGSIPVVALILGMVNVPPEGIGLILGVDRLLDMCRTTLNVSGDLAAAVVVHHSEARRSAFAEPAVPAAGGA